MARQSIKEPPFVIIKWLDAWGEETAEATMSNAHEAHKAVPMETAGWLLKDDEAGASIFCERCIEHREFVYRGRTFIPKGMIVTVTEYKLTKPRISNGRSKPAVAQNDAPTGDRTPEQKPRGTTSLNSSGAPDAITNRAASVSGG